MIAALTRHIEVRGWTWGGGNTGNAREARCEALSAGGGHTAHGSGGHTAHGSGGHTAHGHTAHQELEAQIARARQTNDGMYQVIAVATAALARRFAGALMMKMICLYAVIFSFFYWAKRVL